MISSLSVSPARVDASSVPLSASVEASFPPPIVTAPPTIPTVKAHTTSSAIPRLFAFVTNSSFKRVFSVSLSFAKQVVSVCRAVHWLSAQSKMALP